MIANLERFNKAIALFDAANAQDPNLDDGQPKELRYAQRMTDMIGRFSPEASEVAQLAVRAQHIQRWTVPRSNYPLGKPGYFAWRTGLYQIHAQIAGELMAQAGYDAVMIEPLERAKHAAQVVLCLEMSWVVQHRHLQGADRLFQSVL